MIPSERAHAPRSIHGLSVLVTGANGFVGRHLSRALRSAGASVHGTGLDRPQDLLAEGALESWRACDVTLPDEVRAALAATRPEVVIHLAGQSSAAVSFDQPVETFRVNALGTLALLDGVRWEVPAARVLVVGTGESYGPQPEGTRVNEATPFLPVSPYGFSKAAADAAAEFHARVHGLDIVRTRSFSHLGPGQEPRFAIPGFARQIAAIEAGQAEPILRVGNLDVTRDLTDVRDVVDAYRLLVERGRPGTAYNVCRGEGTRLSDVVERLRARARVPVRIEIDAGRLRRADVLYLVGDSSALRRDTGWRATRSVDAALDEILEECRRHVARDPARS